MKILWALGTFSATVLIACSSGKKITTTRVRPPVQENLPSSLLLNGSFSLTSSLGLADSDYTKTCQTDASAGDACSSYDASKKVVCIIKQRLFCKGPTEVLTLLDGLDGRLAEIEERSKSGDVACVSAAVTDLSSQMTFPGDVTMTQKFSCKDSSIGLGFGQENGTWYVREGNGASGQDFSVSPENVVEGYMWLTTDGSFSQSTGLLHIHSDRSANTVEITGGGVGLGFCGMHFASSSSYIYLIGNPDGVGGSCDYNQDNTTNASDWVEICLSAADLTETDATNCASLKSGLTLKTLVRDKADATGGQVSSWSAAATAPDGVTTSTFEMKDYLTELFTKAKTFDGVSEFKAN